MKQRITLQLSAHTVALNIDREYEEYYRQAGVMLNEKFRSYQKRLPKASVEQLWMYVALETAVNLSYDERQTALEPIKEKINKMNEQIKEIL